MGIFKFPEITYFRASGSQFMANEPVELEWQVLNARHIMLDGVLQKGNGTSLMLTKSQTLELSAVNRNGNASSTLNLSLLIPVVMSFDVDDSVVTEGKPVFIRFCVKHTLQWEIVAVYGQEPTSSTISLAKGVIEDGYLPFEHHLDVTVKGQCKLQLLTSNGPQLGEPAVIRMGIRHLAVNLMTENLVVRNGTVERISWKAENALSLFLYPGGIDVSDVNYYDLPIESEHDLAIELRATGDFGQQVSDFKTLYLARINELYTSNNGDPSNPQFYLNWSSTGLSKLRLYPMNIPVNENSTGFIIPPANYLVPYTLVGQTFNFEEVSATITLYPGSINGLRLIKGRAIIGQIATVSWLADFARKVQFSVSHDPIWRELHITDLSHDFQVFENTFSVKIAIWGDLNISIAEIPVPRFTGPEIRSIVLPEIGVQIGIIWMPLPLPRRNDARVKLSMGGQRITRINQNLLKVISWPSRWAINSFRIGPTKNNKQRIHLLRNMMLACKCLYRILLNNKKSNNSNSPLL